MKLTGARLAIDHARSERADISIHNGRVRIPPMRGASGPEIDLSGYLILPGLINAHDHLEFNLFPRLGRGPYPNSVAWASDIYRPKEPPLQRLLRVPKSTRLFWGGLKNLLSGVTTVAHHNPYARSIFGAAFPVRVVRELGWAHSLHFSPDLRERFRDTPDGWPFVVHAGEGTDEASRDELARLDRMRMLTRRSVLVHAVAADRAMAALTLARGASLIWCPSSNLFLLGRTLDACVLNSSVPIALGTDSSLTAEGDLIDELRVAREVSGLGPERLYRMVTTDAAKILKLKNGEGAIRDGSIADLVVVKDRGRTPAETLADLCPEMVFVGGALRLVSRAMRNRMTLPGSANWQAVELEGRGAWLTSVDLRGAVERSVPVLGHDFRLAARRVWC